MTNHETLTKLAHDRAKLLAVVREVEILLIHNFENCRERSVEMIKQVREETKL